MRSIKALKADKGGTFLGIYNCANAFPVPMQLQPHLFGLLCFVCFAQCLYSGPTKWPLRKIAILSTAVLIFDIIFEYLCIIGLQVAPFSVAFHPCKDGNVRDLESFVTGHGLAKHGHGPLAHDFHRCWVYSPVPRDLP